MLQHVLHIHYSYEIQETGLVLCSSFVYQVSVPRVIYHLYHDCVLLTYTPLALEPSVLRLLSVYIIPRSHCVTITYIVICILQRQLCHWCVVEVVEGLPQPQAGHLK